MPNIKISYQALFVLILFSILCVFSELALANSSLTDKRFISYTDVGKGEPLVLIHAFPTDQRLWEPQREVLKKNFRVITLDLWGFGKSSPVDGQAVMMTEYADEVKQLLDQLHIQKAIIGGESMGGYIALAFLEKYPVNVSGLILSDTQSVADSEESKIKRESTAVDVLAHGANQLINGFLPKALSVDANDQTQQFLRNILESQSSNAIASALRGMALREDTTNILSSTQIPVLIITGDKDTLITPQQSQAMHRVAKQSALIEIANAAHLSSLEKPNEWNQAVTNFFINEGKDKSDGF